MNVRKGVGPTFEYFWAKYFGIFIFGHLFCPFFKIPKYFAQKP